MPRKSRRIKPTVFVVSTTDGERFDQDAMRAWLEVNAPGATLERANKVNAIRAWTLEGCGGPLAWVITISDRAAAFWWKVRWGEDAVAYRRKAKEIDDAFSKAAQFIVEVENERIVASITNQMKMINLDTACQHGADQIEAMMGRKAAS